MLKTFDTVEEFWTWDLIEQMNLEASRPFNSNLELNLHHSSELKQKMFATPSGHQALEELLRSKSNSGKIVMYQPSLL